MIKTRLSHLRVSCVATTSMALIASLLLQACATSQDLSRYEDPSDACVQYRRPIIAAKETEQQERVRSAVVGAFAAGALTSAVAALAGDKKWWQKGLIATGVGALSGYSYTYFRQKAEASQSAEELLTQVDQDALQERGRLTETSQAVLALRDCRRMALNDIRRDYQNETIDQAEARARLAEVREQINEDNKLVTVALEGTDQRVNSYVDATATASEVERSLIVASAERPANRSRRVSDRKVRQVAQTSPNVIKSVEQTEELKDTDAEAREQLAAEVEAMEVLLG